MIISGLAKFPNWSHFFVFGRLLRLFACNLLIISGLAKFRNRSQNFVFGRLKNSCFLTKFCKCLKIRPIKICKKVYFFLLAIFRNRSQFFVFGHLRIFAGMFQGFENQLFTCLFGVRRMSLKIPRARIYINIFNSGRLYMSIDSLCLFFSFSLSWPVWCCWNP